MDLKAAGDMFLSVLGAIDDTVVHIEAMRGAIERVEAYMLALVVLAYALAIAGLVAVGVLFCSRHKRRGSSSRRKGLYVKNLHDKYTQNATLPLSAADV